MVDFHGKCTQAFGLYTLNNQLFSLLKYILEISSNFKTWWAGNGRKPKNTPIQSPNKKTLFVPTCQTNCRTKGIEHLDFWKTKLTECHDSLPHVPKQACWIFLENEKINILQNSLKLDNNLIKYQSSYPQKKLTCPKFLRKFPFEHGPFLRGRIRSFSGLWQHFGMDPQLTGPFRTMKRVFPQGSQGSQGCPSSPPKRKVSRFHYIPFSEGAPGSLGFVHTLKVLDQHFSNRLVQDVHHFLIVRVYHYTKGTSTFKRVATTSRAYVIHDSLKVSCAAFL